LVHHFQLPVGNIERAEEFYARILGINGQRISNRRHYFIDWNGKILVLYESTAETESNRNETNFQVTKHISIAVPDLQETFEKAKQAGSLRIDGSIKVMPWGERLFYLVDPFGNAICFIDEKTLFDADKDSELTFQ
jgi:predicted enzyme related to lactoylglutathione lyase